MRVLRGTTPVTATLIILLTLVASVISAHTLISASNNQYSSGNSPIANLINRGRVWIEAVEYRPEEGVITVNIRNPQTHPVEVVEVLIYKLNDGEVVLSENNLNRGHVSEGLLTITLQLNQKLTPSTYIIKVVLKDNAVLQYKFVV